MMAGVIGLAALLLSVKMAGRNKQPDRPRIASASTERNRQITNSLKNLPIAFEPNFGQAPARAQFVAHGGGYTLMLEPGKAALMLNKCGNTGRSPASLLTKPVAHAVPIADGSFTKPVALTTEFLGANRAASV